MKYVLLLMGNLADDRCGETEEGPGPEEFMAFDAELEKLLSGEGVDDAPREDEQGRLREDDEGPGDGGTDDGGSDSGDSDGSGTDQDGNGPAGDAR